MERVVDRRHDRRRILNDFVVPEPQHTITLPFQPTSSFAVAGQAFALAVLRAIDLDDEVRSEAGEIDDVASEGNLPTKMRAARLKVAQATPENFLSTG